MNPPCWKVSWYDMAISIWDHASQLGLHGEPHTGRMGVRGSGDDNLQLKISQRPKDSPGTGDLGVLAPCETKGQCAAPPVCMRLVGMTLFPWHDFPWHCPTESCNPSGPSAEECSHIYFLSAGLVLEYTPLQHRSKKLEEPGGSCWVHGRCTMIMVNKRQIHVPLFNEWFAA